MWYFFCLSHRSKNLFYCNWWCESTNILRECGFMDDKITFHFFTHRNFISIYICTKIMKKTTTIYTPNAPLINFKKCYPYSIFTRRCLYLHCLLIFVLFELNFNFTLIFSTIEMIFMENWLKCYRRKITPKILCILLNILIIQQILVFWSKNCVSSHFLGRISAFVLIVNGQRIYRSKLCNIHEWVEM